MTDRTNTPTPYGPPAMTLLELRGIRLAETDPAAPGAGPTPAAVDAAPGTAPTPSPTPQAPTPPAPAAPKPGEQQAPSHTPEQTAERIAALNAESKSFRERAEAAEKARDEAQAQVAGFLAVIGRNPDGSEIVAPQPGQQDAAAQAAAAQQAAELAAAKRTNAVLIAAPGARANAQRLLDSVDFRTKLDAIDPADAAAIGGLVTSTVAANAYYAEVPAPAAASAPSAHTGPSTVSGRPDRKAAIAAAVSGQQ